MITLNSRIGRFPAIFTLTAMALGAAGTSQAGAGLVYFGNYGEAVAGAEFDLVTGRFGALRPVAPLAKASFLARSADGRFVYAVADAKGGSLCAFSVGADGALTAVNSRSSMGGGPCDIALSPNGKLVAAANYGGGSVVVYRVEADGALGEQAAFFQHTHASKAHADRQKAAYAHGVTWSPDGKLLLVPDLGGDRVYLYACDVANGTLAVNPAQSWLQMAPAAGPRHAQFSPDGRHLYVINELDNTLAFAAYDAAAGRLDLIEAVSTLPAEGFARATKTAEVAVHPDGRTVYASNRGHDSIAVFRREAGSGKLKLLGLTPVPAHPRHFALSADGRWLLAAGMDANTVEVFAIDPSTGELKGNGEKLGGITKPSCVRF